jgi:hypothetical protein
MLGFGQAIFSAGEYVSDWVADVKKGLNSLYVYCPLVELRMVGDAQVPLLRILLDFTETYVEFILEFRPVPFPLDGFNDPFGRGIIPKCFCSSDSLQK